jgi:hypothetical protein
MPVWFIQITRFLEFALLWIFCTIQSLAGFCQRSRIPGVAQAGAASVNICDFLKVNQLADLKVQNMFLTLTPL